MDTDTPQPRGTKRWLVEEGLRDVTTKYRRQLARDLVFGAATLPDRWLTARQRAFLDLGPDERPDSRTRRAGTDLVRRVACLCDRLVPRLVDDHLRSRAVDRDARRRLRRRTAAVVTGVLLDRCPSWPPADPDRLAPGIRAAVDRALAREYGLRPPPPGGPGLVLRPHDRPVDRRDSDEKLITWATSDDARLWRTSRFLWGQEARHAVRVALGLVVAVAAAVLYLVFFEGLRLVEPTLTVRQAMLVVAAAFGSAVGGGGVGLLGVVLRSRWARGRPGNAPAATRSGGEDPVRPGAR